MLKPGLEVIKLDYSLKPKIKRNDSLFRTRVRKQSIIVRKQSIIVRKQSIIALYFEYENELKLYKLEARLRGYKTFFILNSAEHEFILLINVKMPTIVGILTFIGMINTTSERLKARNFLFVGILVFMIR